MRGWENPSSCRAAAMVEAFRFSNRDRQGRNRPGRRHHPPASASPCICIPMHGCRRVFGLANTGGHAPCRRERKISIERNGAIRPVPVWKEGFDAQRKTSFRTPETDFPLRSESSPNRGSSPDRGSSRPGALTLAKATPRRLRPKARRRRAREIRPA